MVHGACGRLAVRFSIKELNPSFITNFPVWFLCPQHDFGTELVGHSLKDQGPARFMVSDLDFDLRDKL